MTLDRDRLYISYMIETIDRIASYVTGDEAWFSSNTLVQDAVLRNLHTMSETSQRLSDQINQSQPQIDWGAISGFRNVLVHDYLGVDLKLI